MAPLAVALVGRVVPERGRVRRQYHSMMGGRCHGGEQRERRGEQPRSAALAAATPRVVQ